MLLEPQLAIWTINQRIYAGVDSFVLVAVPLFVLAANIMNAAGITDRLIEFALVFFGRVRGGLAMANVGASMIFAGISGSATADSAGIGAVLLPAMERKGYNVGFSVAVTATSSVIGLIIPPSIFMVVWGAYTSTSIGALFLGGVIPGIVLGLGMIGMIMWLARTRQLPREDAISLKRNANRVAKASLALGVPFLVVGGIVGGIVTPTEAGVLAVFYSLFLGVVVFRTVRIQDLPGVLFDSARLCALSLFALSAAAVFGYLLAYYRIPNAIGSVTDTLPAGILLPTIGVVFLAFGTVLDPLPSIGILIPILGPSVAAAGIDPIHYGIVATVAMSIGMVTPPYGLCLLIASKIGGISVAKSLRAMLPFYAFVLLVLAVVIFVEPLTLILPNLLM